MRPRGLAWAALLGLVVVTTAAGAAAQQNPQDFIEEITPEPDPEPAARPDPSPAAPDPAPDPAPADPPPPDPVAPSDRPPDAGGDSATRRRAGNDPKAPPANDAKKPPGPKVGEEDGVVIRELSYAGLLERWDARRAAARARDSTQLRRAEALFLEGMADLGLHGLEGGPQAPDLAHALLIESRSARALGEHERARSLFEMARRASPDSPGVHFAGAELELDIGSVPGAAQAVVAAVRATLRSPDHLTAAAARAAAALTLVLLALLWVAALVGLVTAFRYLTFDLWAALPRGAARWQVTTLLLIATVVPVIAGAGPVFALLLWLTLAWLYLDARTQGALFVVGVAALAVPFVVETGALLFSYQGSRVDKAYTALVDVAADEERALFSATKDAGGLLLAAEVAVAEAAFREGRLDEARARWSQVVKREPLVPWTHNNLGVLAAIEGNDDLAEAAFRDALSREPGFLEAAYNLSVLQLRNPRRTKPDVTVQGLLDGAGPRIEELRSVTFRRGDQPITQNRAFVWASMPRPVIATLFELPPEAAASFEAETAKLLYLGLRPYPAAGAIGAFLLVWFVLSRLKVRLMPSRPCEKCGSPASRRYDGKDVPAGMCSACFHAFVSRKSDTEAGMRANKERQIAAYQRARSRSALLASLLFAGAGHLLLGAPVRGLAYGYAFALSAGTALAVVLDVIPWPSPATSTPTWILWGPPALLAVVLYALSVRGAAALRED